MFTILILSPLYYPHHIGGAEISTQLLAEGLQKTGAFDVTVLCHSDGASTEDSVNGVRVIRRRFPAAAGLVRKLVGKQQRTLPENIWGKIVDLTGSRRRRKYFSALFPKYDLVILSGNGLWMGRQDMWRAAQKANVPFVMIIRDPLLIYPAHSKPARWRAVDLLYRKLSTRRLSDVPYFVGVTQWMLYRHKENGIKLANACVIYNMVQDDLCDSLPYEQKEDTILYVGAIGPHKGCHTLIEAFRRISGEIPSYRLVLIGNNTGIEIPNDIRIEARGPQELRKVYASMRRAKVLVLPSEWDEAFGRVLVEAVFNGTIALGSDRGGIPEVFDFQKEFTFSAGDAESMGKLIKKYAALDKQAYEQTLAQQQKLFERYRGTVCISRWKTYLQEIITNWKYTDGAGRA